MLDQNTDRMWFVIGALVVGAGIILIVNKTMPEVFANVTNTFSNVANDGIASTDGLDNRNYFYFKDFTDRMYTNQIDTQFYTVTLQLEPNTTYTASTNVPIVTNEFSSRNVFFTLKGDTPKNSLNGVSVNEPITLTTDYSGKTEVSFRKGSYAPEKRYGYQTFLNGEFWLMINKGDEVKPYRLAVEDM